MTTADVMFEDLYRDLILDHYRRPRRRGVLDEPTVRAEGMNPVCGDEVRIDLLIANGRIDDIAFGGQGCSISMASASMLTTQVHGQPVAEARHIADAFRAMLLDGAKPGEELGDLEALEGVAKFPVRVKCALLPWNVLEQGLAKAANPEKETPIG
jgi:nitrogen fixation NifU-like protein